MRSDGARARTAHNTRRRREAKQQSSKGNIKGECRDAWDDDDDWTGTPPEGHHSASQANPGFWADNRTPLSITGIGVGIALIILLIVWLT